MSTFYNFMLSHCLKKAKRTVLIGISFISTLSIVNAQPCLYGTPQVTCNLAAPTKEGSSITCNIVTSGNIFRVNGMVAGATYRVSNCGSGFDTQISIFPKGGGTSQAYNDDNGIACSGTAASMDFVPVITGTYDLKLTKWNCLTDGIPGALTVTLEPPANPCNDVVKIPDCGISTGLTILSGNGIYDIPVTTCGFSTPGKENIFSFTAATTGNYSLDVNSIESDGGYIDFMYKDAAIGCNESGWYCIGDLNTPGNVGTISMTGGTKYYILLDPEFTAGATCSFTISCSASKFDPCSDIGFISSCNEMVTATIPEGTGIYNTTSASCSAATPGKEQIFSFSPAVSGNYSINTSGVSGGYFDFLYKEATVCSDSNWICIGATDTAGRFGPLTMIANTIYYILLDPEFTSGGSCTFSIPCLGQTVINDNVCNPIMLQEGNNGPYSNEGASVELNEPAPPDSGCNVLTGWCDSVLEHTIWFTFTAPSSGRISLSSAGFDTQLAIWQAGDCSDFSSFSLIAANDNDSLSGNSLLNPVNCLVPGREYYVQLDGKNGDTGDAIIGLQYLNSPDAGFSGLLPAYCSIDSPSLLVPVTPGGIFSGPGIENNLFKPALASAGIDTITYSLNSCYSSFQTTLLNVAGIWYKDNDNDGYGNPSIFTESCNRPLNFVSNDSDCNDNNGAVHPGAIDSCTNNIDDNCDGVTDNGSQFTFYSDADQDGYGNSSDTIHSCVPSPGYVNVAGDCDDGNPEINPAALEACNGIDDNCNGETDEGITLVFYADSDGDGYGKGTSSIQGCIAPEGYVSDSTDCNDNDSTAHALQFFYADRDHDGFGGGIGLSACKGTAPTGFTTVNGDCNDRYKTINPNALELCNGIDDNCNGIIDDSSQKTYYIDKDSDQFGDPDSSILSCTPQSGYAEVAGDCNDGDAGINPDAAETCNGIDDNCNGTIDDNSQKVYYQDMDSDSYGNSDSSFFGCTPPAGYTEASGDCNDNNPEMNPGVSETCNGLDDNCNGITDDNALSATITALGPTDFCAQGSVVLKASPADSSYTYLWIRDSVILSSHTRDSTTAKRSGMYSVIISDSNCTDTSGIITVNEIPKPVVSIMPSGTLTICPGIPVTLSALTDEAVAYQWKKGGTDIAGAIDSVYIVPEDSTGKFKVSITTSEGCHNSSDFTIISRLEGPKKAEITVLNGGNLDLCSGNVRLQSNGSSSLVYQWYKNDILLAGATGRSLYPKKPGDYKVQVTLKSDSCSRFSAPVTVTSSCRLSDGIDDNILGLSIFPNPADNKFTINLREQGATDRPAIMQMINTLGQVIYTRTEMIVKGKLITEINLEPTLSSNTYLVKIITAEKVYTEQLIIQH
ncbi:MAG: T9SS type A sorting domain-containing protein [Chitinophagales bacterium]|nr:T9SS type A sorting domain-containing protein [Chitinophagales bacterium]